MVVVVVVVVVRCRSGDGDKHDRGGQTVRVDFRADSLLGL